MARLQLRVVDPASGRVDFVLLTADPESPLDDVARALATVQPRPLVFSTGPGAGSPMGGPTLLRDSGLRDGTELSTTFQAAAPPDAPFEVAVVAGPDAGRSTPLGMDEPVLVGRDDECQLCLRYDDGTSRRHLALSVDRLGPLAQDIGSTNGTALDGRLLPRVSRVGPNDQLDLGATSVVVRATPKADADLRSEEDGTLAFNRPARIRPGTSERRVTFPAPPPESDPPAFPWLQALAPLVVAGAALVVFHRPEMLLFALLSPVVMVGNSITNRRRRTRKDGAARARYVAASSEATARLASLAGEELLSARSGAPDLAELVAIATGPGRRLWERRSADGDFLVLRVGSHTRPAAVVTTGLAGAAPDPPLLYGAPVVVDLRSAGVLGLAGEPADTRGIARGLLVQLAVLHSPRAVQLVVLTDPEAEEDWGWVRWLPHARPDGSAGPVAWLGNDTVNRAERVKELLGVLEARREASQSRTGASFVPAIVVVYDGVRSLRTITGVAVLLRDGPALGIYAIGLDVDAGRLAEEGRAEVVCDPDEPDVGTVRIEDRQPAEGVVLDRLAPDLAEMAARGLGPLRDPGGGGDEAVVPTSIRLVDLLQLDLETPDDVLSRWALGGRGTAAVIGAGANGPFALDLRRDGPHGLVAGTTGAGKSELLQTLVASLAVANRPDALQFVLVDYKGASAFADCEDLPHTVGLVTNLDSHLTERALASLDAELRRREGELRRLGSPDVDTVWERRPDDAAASSLARLVLVIDEFAELVHELPDFVTGLIRVARVGRSLGVHLLLATQRPAGVVSAEMRANTGLRIGLRMRDKGDSAEVLDSPDAATISGATPGRAYARTSASPSLTQFQTARVAARRRGHREELPPAHAAPVPWTGIGQPAPLPSRAVEVASEATDLHAVVAVVRAAAERLNLPVARRPWLPPLPEMVVLTDLGPDPTARPPSSGDTPQPAPFGLQDHPSEQAQRPAAFDPTAGDHLLVIGAPRSGRSTLLRTLGASLASKASPSDLHLVAFDFGGGALHALTSLPHCGAVVARTEVERAERLVSRLVHEVTARRELLASSGVGDIGEQRRGANPSGRMAYLVVLLDRWDALVATLGSDSEAVPHFTTLAREGPAVGISLVIAGDRTLFNDRLAGQVEAKLVLRLADKNDYLSADIRPRSVPDGLPPGRGLWAGRGDEVQAAVVSRDSSAAAQAEAIRALGREMGGRWPAAEHTKGPMRVDGLPRAIPLAEALAMAGPSSSALRIVLGVGGDELTVITVDLAIDGPGLVIAGPPKTGRSTAAMAVARSALAAGARVVAICPRPSPLRNLRGDGVTVLTGQPTAADIEEAVGGDGPLVVVVDDAEVMVRTEADEALKAFCGGAAGRAALVVAGGIDELRTELRGAIPEARKSGLGLVLSPEGILDGELMGLRRLDRNVLGRKPPGRGTFGCRGQISGIQVPL